MARRVVSGGMSSAADTHASTPSTPGTLTSTRPRRAPSARLLAWIGIPLLLGLGALTVIGLVHEPEYVVLARVTDAQSRWFRTAIDPFVREHGADIQVRSYTDVLDLRRQLELDRRAQKPRVLLVQVPHEGLAPLVDADLVLPLVEVAKGGGAARLASAFLPQALAAGRLDDTLFFLPRELETHCLFYSRSRVADAVENWSAIRDTVQAWLRAVNGYGLPDRYALEADPRRWDQYDVAVAAAYWASRPMDGLRIARVAHRTRRYAGTALELATRAYQMNASSAELLALEGQPLVDALAWESFFLRHGLYHPSMLGEGWEGGDLYTAIAQDQIYLCYLSPSELFLVHGSGDAAGYLRNRDDFGVSVVPAGVSLELKDGRPARVGGRGAARYGKWWGVPTSCRNRPLARALLEHVTSAEFMQTESRGLGLFPVRKDLHKSLDDVFRDGWAREIMQISKRQILLYGVTPPESSRWLEAQVALVDAWYELCVEQSLTRPRALARALRAFTSRSATAIPPGDAEDAGPSDGAAGAGGRTVARERGSGADGAGGR